MYQYKNDYTEALQINEHALSDHHNFEQFDIDPTPYPLTFVSRPQSLKGCSLSSKHS